MPEILEIMAAVKQRTKVAVLTNNHTLVREHLDFLFPSFLPYAATILCLGAIRRREPDPLVYLRCVAAAAGKPGETLFIDDSKANVDGARAAGLQGHLFTNAAALRAALQGLGLQAKPSKTPRNCV